jgi:hypothetical protein
MRQRMDYTFPTFSPSSSDMNVMSGINRACPGSYNIHVIALEYNGSWLALLAVEVVRRVFPANFRFI